MVNYARNLRKLGYNPELFFYADGNFRSMIPEEQVVHYGDLFDLLMLVRSGGYEVVHGATEDWSLGTSAVRRFGVKLVLTCHGRSHPSWNSTNCDAIVGCSEWEAAAQEARTDLPVSVIPNGVDTDYFSPQEPFLASTPIVAWVGRGSDLQQKRIELFAQIAPVLSQLGLNIWIADPDGPDKVPASVAESLVPIAKFWGRLSPEQMPGFFRKVAASGGCMLSTSRFEGLSVAQLEAQACGCVVIGPDLPGINEAVRPEHGGVLYPDTLDVEKIAALVAATLNQRTQMLQRQKQCRHFVVTKFNDVTMAERYLQVYRKAPTTVGSGWRNLRVRHQFSPYVDLAGYRDFRWTAGHNQYLASRKLKSAGERDLALQTALESLRISPTLYTRWSRAYHLATLLPRIV